MTTITDQAHITDRQYIELLEASMWQHREIACAALAAMKYTGTATDFYGEVRSCLFCGRLGRTLEAPIPHAEDCPIVVTENALVKLGQTTK